MSAPDTQPPLLDKGHPCRAESCERLAESLLDRFEETGDVLLLDKAIELDREALCLRSTRHPDRARSCGNLALGLRIRYDHTGDTVLLDEVLELEREALHLRPKGHPDRALSCGNLAVTLRTRFTQTGDTVLLDEALELEREALHLRPEGHPDRAGSCVNLAITLRTRFIQTGDTGLLDEGLELQREVLRLRPKGHPDYPISCGDLAVALQSCFDQTGDTLLLDEAIALQKEALRLLPEGHPVRAHLCGNLADSLRTRFDQTGHTASLDEALELGREALRLRPTGHPDRAKSCGSLAVALRTRFNQTGHTVLLDEALDLEREALHLRPKGHPHRAVSCGNLAVALRSCFNQTGHPELLDKAIALQREALHLEPEGHSDRAHSCGGLATLLMTRFYRTGYTGLLKEALELEREALRLRPEGHPDRAISCGNLAEVLRWGFNLDQTGQTVMLDEAIALQKEALRLRPEGHPHRALSCGNLAISLRTRFDRTGHIVLLDEALELEREALRLRPEGDPNRAMSCGNLAVTLRTRFNRTGDMRLLEEARSLCTRAIVDSAVSPYDHVSLRAELAHIYALPTYSSWNPSAAVELLLEAIQYRTALITHFYHFSEVLRMCAKVTTSDEDHVRLLDIYEIIITILPEMGSVLLPKLARLRRWREAGNLPVEALLQALKVNNLHMGLELLEQGRAVLWSETLAIKGTDLQGLPDEWKTQLQMLLQSVSTAVERGNSQHSVLAARDRAHASYTQLQQLLECIRVTPGLERFMRGPTYSDLVQVASANPVIILAASDTACHALVLSSASASSTHLVLSKISSTDIELLGHEIRGMDLNVRALSEHLAAKEVRGVFVTGQREDPALRKLHKALERLWADVVKPILDSLGFKKSSGRDRPRLHWCPVGALVFLPIHAAGMYSQSNLECCSDYVVSSYTPTLSALRKARVDLVPRASQSLVLLAAAASDTVKSLGLSPLYNVRSEMDHVVRIARAMDLNEIIECGQTSAATVHEVTQALPCADIVHLACHGLQNPTDPLHGGFCLGDGKLTVCKLMDIKLDRAFLAFLSACETAKGDKEQPDQVIHLAAAMLFCGFRSIVATMWSMSDEDGPAVARAFYETLLAKEIIDADDVAYALDEAVSILKGRNVSPARWASFIHVGA